MEYTHPDVLGVGVRDGWADPETDPARIDWVSRQAAAAIPFQVVQGRPVNPCQSTGIDRGRNELGRWGEQLAVDALVTVRGPGGGRWILMVLRDDGHGWAIPGGVIDPGEAPLEAAARELAEETGLRLPAEAFTQASARYVPDPRGSDEAWIVTVPAACDLGTHAELPAVAAGSDAAYADWIRADTYTVLTRQITERGGRIFPAHEEMLRDHLDATL